MFLGLRTRRSRPPRAALGLSSLDYTTIRKHNPCIMQHDWPALQEVRETVRFHEEDRLQFG